MKSAFIRSCCLMLLLAFFGTTVAAENAAQALEDLQNKWAVNNYQLKGKQQQQAFENLLETADRYVDQYPDNAAILVWRGIINSSFAGVKGGLGALGYAKASKADLEKAMELDDQVLEGSAYTSLGTLYFKVPGWPVGFGNDKKAENLLKKALEINPDGIDPNYFYGEYLRENKRYSEAEKYLKLAIQAPARPGRQLADDERRKEIQASLTEVESKLTQE